MPSPLWKTIRLTALPLAFLLVALPAPATPQSPPPVIINGGGPMLPNPHSIRSRQAPSRLRRPRSTTRTSFF